MKNRTNLNLETLEQRWVPTQYTWAPTGPTVNFFSSANQWINNDSGQRAMMAPSAAIDCVFPSTAAYDCVVTTGSAAGSLRTSGFTHDLVLKSYLHNWGTRDSWWTGSLTNIIAGQANTGLHIKDGNFDYSSPAYNTLVFTTDIFVNNGAKFTFSGANTSFNANIYTSDTDFNPKSGTVVFDTTAKTVQDGTNGEVVNLDLGLVQFKKEAELNHLTNYGTVELSGSALKVDTNFLSYSGTVTITDDATTFNLTCPTVHLNYTDLRLGSNTNLGTTNLNVIGSLVLDGATEVFIDVQDNSLTTTEWISAFFIELDGASLNIMNHNIPSVGLHEHEVLKGSIEGVWDSITSDNGVTWQDYYDSTKMALLANIIA